MAAQVSLPRVGVPDVGGVLDQADDTLERSTREIERQVEKLARDRLRRIDRLVRRNSDAIELDVSGAPARRGELLVMDAPEEALERASQSGFTVLSRENIEGLDFAVVRLGVPEGMSLSEGQKELRGLLPGAEISADNLHFQSGNAGVAIVALSASSTSSAGAPVGMIDGAPSSAVKVSEIRGFAKGAPYPSNHGSAVASLLAYAGAGPIRVADVYGTDKAGGNALAIAKGLGWLVARGSKVVTISLVGPRNSVLGRSIAAAQSKGTVVVAAVGNDGPASPPSYPASYTGVVAVTAVDGKRRPLIEAGRALHLDYAAPGADIYGRNAKGRRVELRGTSFATPLVAARTSQAIARGRSWRSALDSEAEDLGAKGHDEIFGRGLVCASCTGR
ncbi:extracellular protease [Erythrobacter sp. SD-21]|nr:extracellular protease [Erythrobacter sp. SD-21]